MHYCTECGQWAELDTTTDRCADCIAIWQESRAQFVAAGKSDYLTDAYL